MRPAELQDALAKVLGDPDLRIAYPRPDRTFVDAGGLPVVLPEPGEGRSVAVVEHAGEQVAALVYDHTLDDDPELVEAVGAAATIALENRQLHAEAQARLAELQASRERIIAAGDAERRRIERNLHDGAQQGLVTLALQLSLIQRRIREDPDGAEQLAGSASDELARSLAELRELARGIHPVALDQGLDTALEALVMRSAVPTTVTVAAGPPLPEPVAFAAYFVISEALTNVAKYARATSAVVRLTRPGGLRGRRDQRRRDRRGRSPRRHGAARARRPRRGARRPVRRVRCRGWWHGRARGPATRPGGRGRPGLTAAQGQPCPAPGLACCPRERAPTTLGGWRRQGSTGTGCCCRRAGCRSRGACCSPWWRWVSPPAHCGRRSSTGRGSPRSATGCRRWPTVAGGRSSSARSSRSRPRSTCPSSGCSPCSSGSPNGDWAPRGPRRSASPGSSSGCSARH